MIRTLTARPTLIAALSASLLVAACSDETDRTTAKFSTADAAHLERALGVIGANDVGSLLIVGMFVAGSDEPGCPSITTTGNVTTVAGGCNAEDGTRLEGQIVVTNVQGIFTSNPSYDPSKPSTVEAKDWTAIDVGAPAQSITGKVTMTNTGGVADNGGTLTGTVDADVDGIFAHSDITYTCDATDHCTHGGGSWVDIDGVGMAELSGTWGFDEPRSGAITATGAETLVLDMAASTDDCRVFRIGGGANQMVCEPVDPGARQAPGAGNPWLKTLGR